MIHRMVDFDASTHPYGSRVCGATDGKHSIMASGYDCPQCVELTPGLQMLGILERLLANEDYDRMPVPPTVISRLDAIANLLKGRT